MASTAEIQLYLRHHFARRLIDLLRPILEGPPVNEQSIRFPPSRGDDCEIMMELERLFVQEERQFYNQQNDYYIGSSGGDCCSLAEWGRQTRTKLLLPQEKQPQPSDQQEDHNKARLVILDLHGHYCTAIIYRHEGSSPKCVILETIKDNDTIHSPAVLALVKALSIV